MSIGAKWHFAAADFETVERAASYDPLSDAAYAPPLPPIKIDTPTDELDGYVLSLLDQEAHLFDDGVTCSIKGLPDSTCLACPVSCARDNTNPKGQLCRVGQEQERVGTVLVAQHHGFGV